MILAVALALLLAPGAANAQVLYGSLIGNVTDPSGAAIAGARVVALNTGTGVERQAATDERGAYIFTNLQTGDYRVTISAGSFKTSVTSNVRVSQNEVRRVDAAMQISSVGEVVEVSAAAEILQTDKADVHKELSKMEVTQLPYSGTQGKNFQSLLFLTPGAGIVANVEANSEAGNPQRAITLFMNGVSSTGNSTKLDGATISYPWLPVNVAYVPPTEAIETVNISTNSFDAEQGAAGGAAVNVQIKSGTNALHGVVFERNQNNALNAVPFFQHTTTSPLPKNVFNQFGFAVGGPVIIPKIINGRNKLFFFADYEGTRRIQYAAALNNTLPTAAMRTGDFSGTGTTIYDPLTGNPDGTGRTPFEGNRVPTNRIDLASAKLTSLMPELTRPNDLVNNTDMYGSTYYKRGNWDFKVNGNPNDKLMLWGRYSVSPMDIYAPLIFGTLGGNAFSGGNPGHAGGRVQTTAAGFTYTVSPTIVIDGNAGYTRQNIGANGDIENEMYGLDVLQIPGTNGVGPNYMGLPGFQVTNMSNIGNTNTGSPFQFRDNQYTTAINLGKVQGSHSLRFGFEYQKYALNHFQPQGGTFGTARGTFGFDGTLTALRGGTQVNPNGAPTNSYAGFLLGFPSRAGKITQFQNPNALRFSAWGFYARDQWQVTSKLTFTYGLRWEYYPILSHDWYGATRFDLESHNILIGGQSGVPWDTGASATKRGFAPRIGLAYRFTPKTVIRAGYGITVDPDNMRNQRNAYPSVINQDYQPASTYQFITNSGAPRLSLRTGIPAPNYPDITAGTITPSTTASPQTYLPSTAISTTFPKFVNRGYIQSWNFFIQREFTPSLVADLGYAGTHGVNTIMGVNINGAAPGTGTAGRQLYPYVNSDFNCFQPFGFVTYNSLQTTVKKRFGSSIVGIAYTFSKAINNVNGDNGDGTLWRAFPMDYKLSKGRAGFDRPHIFQLYHVYDLPFGKGRKWLTSGALNWIFGGFQISGQLSRYSGLPFTVGASGSTLNAGGQAQSADQLNPVVRILGGHDSNNPYFDGTAFGPINTARLGSSGRNILRGPGLFQINQSVSKTFSFGEKFKLQLLGEAFNLTNTPVFNNPASTYAAQTTRPDGSINYGNYSVITSTVGTARILQVGGKLTF